MTSQIKKVLPTLEKVFLAAIILYLLLKTIDLRIPYLLHISIVGLAITFFLNAYHPKELKSDEDQKSGFSELLSGLIIPKVLWISTAIVTIGILFYLMNFEGSAEMLMVGSISIVISGVIGLIIATTKTNDYFNILTPIFYRALPALLIACYILYNNMARIQN